MTCCLTGCPCVVGPCIFLPAWKPGWIFDPFLCAISQTRRVNWDSLARNRIPRRDCDDPECARARQMVRSPSPRRLSALPCKVDYGAMLYLTALLSLRLLLLLLLLLGTATTTAVSVSAPTHLTTSRYKPIFLSNNDHFICATDLVCNRVQRHVPWPHIASQPASLCDEGQRNRIGPLRPTT